MAAYAAGRDPQTRAGDVLRVLDRDDSAAESDHPVDHLGSQDAVLGFPPQGAVQPHRHAGSAILEADASGTYAGGSYVYATARDWARFGLLYLNDGVWAGERILPEGWVSSTPGRRASVQQGEYGVQFWLNRGPAGAPNKRPYPASARRRLPLRRLSGAIGRHHCPLPTWSWSVWA